MPAKNIPSPHANHFTVEYRHAPVAQLDRASGFEPEGREFESLRARHFFQTFVFHELR
jgi:hypothetical protein